MKLEKYLAGLVCVFMLSSMLTACGESEEESDSESTAAEVTQSESEQTYEMESEAEESVTDSSETVSSEADVSADAAETESTASDSTDSESGYVPATNEDFVPADGLDESYVNLECMKFAFNGTVYTLGETTFQELIDGGVPFSESDLNNIGNNVNANYTTSTYTVSLNDYNSLQFSFSNFTSSNCTEAECVVTDVRWYTLYVPNTEYEDSLNQEIESLIADASESIGFSFPLTLTKDQLLEACPDGEDDSYGVVKYTLEAEQYYGSRAYTFTFDKTTNRLKDVSIYWLP